MTRRGARIACGIFFLLPLWIDATEVRMTYAQYEKELTALQNREKNAKEQVASEQARIENLKSQHADYDLKIAGVRQELFSILGITVSDCRAADSEIASIRRQLEAVLGLSPQEAKNLQGDVAVQESRIAKLQKKPVSFLWKIRDQLVEAQRIVERAKEHIASAMGAAAPPSDAQSSVLQQSASALTSYTVQGSPGKHESLFEIAAHDSVFGDPGKWTLLYQLNKEKIDKQYQMYLKRNPKNKYLHPEDLIFPGQVLEIPR
jgi:hypothetical protein